MAIAEKIGLQQFSEPASVDLPELPIDSATKCLRILLIEDDEAFQRIIHYRLTQAFGRGVRIKNVIRLADALEQLRGRADDDFDLVITDLSVPDSTGLATFRSVREATRLPVIILTGDSAGGTVRTAMREGADEVLLKDDLTEQPLWRAIAFVLEKEAHKKAERELSAAQELQRSLYPSIGPLLTGFDIAGAAFPAEKNCGDYFDFLPLTQGRVGLVVGDVSGHGLGPAVMAMQTRAFLHSLADMSEYLDWNKETMDPGEMLTHTNRLLTQFDGTRFVTLWMAEFDPHEKSFCYSSAGHLGYILRAGGRLDLLQSTGTVLGMMSGIAFTTNTVRLESGDLLFVPTDGFEEAMDEDGHPWGRERMIAVVEEHRGEPAEDIIRALYAGVTRFRGIHPQRDDMTAIVLKVD